jgi:hypothetical protein
MKMKKKVKARWDLLLWNRWIDGREGELRLEEYLQYFQCTDGQYRNMLVAKVGYYPVAFLPVENCCATPTLQNIPKEMQKTLLDLVAARL